MFGYEIILFEGGRFELRGEHTFYNGYKTIDDIFEMSKDEKIKDAIDNRFNFTHQQDLFFDSELDSEGACAGVCEAFS